MMAVGTEENRGKLLTLCIVHDAAGGRVLLGMKKKGFGAERWNGFGGKVEPGETVEEAAVRELQEEAGIAAVTITPQARLRFTHDVDDRELDVHVFLVSEFTGEPVETQEMSPKWFAVEEIPYHAMWQDDQHWLPRFLAGEALEGEFHFADLDDQQAKLLHHRIVRRT
jgi:8-oxo-dGTP diphosphatase/2-hydroxy-dATP diphosphatase